MKIACDPTTLVVLTGDAPSTWNGVTLTVYDLTPAQEAAWNALPSDRSGTKFDGTTFTAVYPDPVLVQQEAAAKLAASNGRALRQRHFERNAKTDPSSALLILKELVK